MTVRSAQASPARKRLVVCSDGTWQSSVSDKFNIPSNVTRLTRNIATAGLDDQGNVVQQICYYDSGIGTGSITGFEKKRQGGTGDGLAINVLEAYNFLCTNYEYGDEVFCFGFSRGAYTARAVAGLVNDIGILHRGQMQRLPDLYAAYKSNKEKGKPFLQSTAFKKFASGVSADGQKNFNGKKTPEPLEEFKDYEKKLDEKDSRWVKVVGVWDTVGSLGVPNLPDISWITSPYSEDTHRFHNVELSQYTEHAFHALALDERREPFGPTLWSIPYDKKQAWTNGSGPDSSPRLLQVWFPGVHINIGGGSDDMLNELKGDLEQISNVTFAWMLEQITPFLAFEKGAFEEDIQIHERLLDDIAEQEVTKGWFSNPFSKPEKRKVKRGWANGNIVDSADGWIRILGVETRRPGEIKTADGILHYTIGDTCEQMHPTVAFRDALLDERKHDLYEPEALKGWKKPPSIQELKNDPAKLEKVKKEGFVYTKTASDGTPLRIPEYVIKQSKENFEREAAALDLEGKAQEFLKYRDAVNFQ